MNTPSEIHLADEGSCTVCEPDWLVNLRADVRMRHYWDALPRINLVAGQA